MPSALCSLLKEQGQHPPRHLYISRFRPRSEWTHLSYTIMWLLKVAGVLMSCYYQKGPLFHSSAGSEAPLPLYCRSGSNQATEPVQSSKPVEKKETSFFSPAWFLAGLDVWTASVRTWGMPELCRESSMNVALHKYERGHRKIKEGDSSLVCSKSLTMKL